MKKIIVSIHSSFNGVVTGPADDPTNFMTWAQTGIEDYKEFSKNFDTVDTIMLGRGTYEDLSKKWPFAKDWPNVTEENLHLANIINNMPKIIVAGEHKINNPKWGEFETPRQLTGHDIEAQIKALKEQEGGDIITFGSPKLVQSLTNANLVDEYRILVHPVIVGEGGYLFNNIVGHKDLKLLSTQTLEHGAMLVCYGLVKSGV
ncbi:dihydrofolate reductase family protein [Galbibacter sp. EGI 63066]|uniref:dihydrofolate reductase family protein n=1 Tax=Galbibacter sp. EGI 63066 TaxID=2993559 RepID=UPI002248DE74|nr:dihydrofolate reductase family protein [Galbibacter sp. EGI 63066]MCX2679774.1 dihydrofolate reductase family protein [Galbibacter sp. EGI 63066]